MAKGGGITNHRAQSPPPFPRAAARAAHTIDARARLSSHATSSSPNLSRQDHGLRAEQGRPGSRGAKGQHVPQGRAARRLQEGECSRPPRLEDRAPHCCPVRVRACSQLAYLGRESGLGGPLGADARDPARRTAAKLVCPRSPCRAETHEDMSEENFVPQTTEKTAEQTERIMAGINNNELLSGRAVRVIRHGVRGEGVVRGRALRLPARRASPILGSAGCPTSKRSLWSRR